MSKVVNKAGFKAGSIYRIALKNFVTYKDVELFPGNSLNLIIGPNGTGKSTFVCAIILGLCGKTSVIGRAKKISEYVRSGCEEATIDIELYQEKGQKNVIITRIFNLRDNTTWKIDGKTVRERQVQELIAGMNIQVDNLCQLLPQDRVQDFSKMDPQQLLRSTLAAVGGGESVRQLDELIACRSEHRGLATRLQNNAQLLEEKRRANERLKVTIDAMEQRKQIEEEIAMCERKKYWLEYQELREKVVEYRRDKDMAVKLVETQQKKLEPLERSLGRAKSGIGKLEQQKVTTAREVRNLKDKLKESIDSVKAQEYVIKDLEARLVEKTEQHSNRERELAESKAKLDKLLTDKAKLAEKAGDEASIKMELAELHKLLAKANAAVDALNRQKLEASHALENQIIPQIRLYQNKIRQLQDVDEKRLEALNTYSPDARAAVDWLRENRHLFKHNVYEPMMLEVNFTDPKFARYLENRVSNRDLLAFTFEDSQDMNLFLRKVRQEGGLRRVNALHSEGGAFRYQRNDISQLSYLGFYTYLVDTITAPDPIVRYLCRNYNIHNIPIGNNHTYKNSSKVPDHIRYFFTENHRFSVRISAYSGAKSNSTVEISPARLLANSVDLEQMENYREQLASVERSQVASISKINELEGKVGTLESNLNDLNMQRKRITDSVEKVKAIGVQIRLQTRKVQELENEPAFDLQKEKAECRRLQRNVVLKQCRLQQELAGVMAGLQHKLLNGEAWKVKLDISRDAIAQQESELRELKDDLRNAQTTLENISAHLSRADTNARAKLLEAKKACGSKALPHDKEFPYRTQFEQLPADLTQLQEHYYELQTRVDCMDKGDEQVIKEYESRAKEIQKLEADVNSHSDGHKHIQYKMNQIRAEWLPPLEALLRDIDKSFGEMFEKMGCAGEVQLDKAGDDDDYDKYGISILVRFRQSEQLQQLTRHAQSGGERALSTAMYLLALQRLTMVPFRCVDEINQGMDAINERKMFQLLVKATTECDNAQYFLLTPKLLTNLEYNPKIMVHTIMNGRQIMNYEEWKYDVFLQNARAYKARS